MSIAQKKPLRISIDALSLADPRRTGIGRYLESILPLLVELGAGEAEFTLFAGKPICNPVAIELLRAGKLQAVHGNLPSLYGWQQTLMMARLARYRPDVHFAPDGLIPMSMPCPAVGVMHDMIWRRYPRTASWHIRLIFSLRQRRSLDRLAIALADSAATRRDILSEYGSVGERTRVVPLGVDARLFRPASEGDHASIAAFRRRLGLPNEYLLAVGNLRPHKNLGVIFRALGLIGQRRGEHPPLVVIGAGDLNSTAGDMLQRLNRSRIFSLGYLSDEDVQLAYRCARVLVFPSLYEGFGLPILEAMASGTPVVYSGKTSLPEVAGDAAILFDPSSPESLAEVIERVWNDAALRMRFSRSGLEQAARFSWHRCTQAVWRALLEAARPDIGATDREGYRFDRGY